MLNLKTPKITGHDTMITQTVIDEIYKKYSKPPKKIDELQVPYYLQKLSAHHNISVSPDQEEIIIDDFDNMNPFKRFLVRRLTAILEFERMVAFAFDNHIIFFQKDSPDMRVHFKPEKKRFLSRLFGK